MKRTRRHHAAAFKAKVALAALKGDKTLTELSQPFAVHVNQITLWKSPLLERASELFATAAERNETAGPSVKALQAKIGPWAMEKDCLAGALGRRGEASAKRGSSPRTRCRWFDRVRCWTGPGHRSITRRRRSRRAIWR